MKFRFTKYYFDQIFIVSVLSVFLVVSFSYGSIVTGFLLLSLLIFYVFSIRKAVIFSEGFMEIIYLLKLRSTRISYVKLRKIGIVNRHDVIGRELRLVFDRKNKIYIPFGINKREDIQKLIDFLRAKDIKIAVKKKEFQEVFSAKKVVYNPIDSA